MVESNTIITFKGHFDRHLTGKAQKDSLNEDKWAKEPAWSLIWLHMKTV